MINFTYSRATTAQAAIEMQSKNNSTDFIAGGTNIIDLMKRGVTAPQHLVDITQLPLSNIEKSGNSLVIGAMATNKNVAEHPLVKSEYPLLALAINAGASAQLRNMATTGGNIMQRTRCTYFYDTSMPCNKRNPNSGCAALKGYNRMHAIFGASAQCIAVHPSDMCVALAALDTTVIVQGLKGERKIPFTQFHRLPGDAPQKDNTLAADELIVAIEIGPKQFTNNVAYIKIRDRNSYAFALVSAAVALTIENNIITDARIAMGGVAHKPWRLNEAENYLKGKTVSINVFNEAAKLAMTNAKGYGENNFKLKLAPQTIVEALKKASKI